MNDRAVCFDLDDTLYDYREYAAAGLRAAADLLESRTGERVHDELHRLYFDEGVTENTFDVLLERRGLPEALLDDLVAAYHGATEPLTPYPATQSVLSSLGSDNRLGLITDGRRGRAKLRRLGVHDHFDTVVVTPTLCRSKRDAEVFERALSDLAVPPTAAVYVGDDPRVDFRRPNELGMTTVRLRRGRYVDLDPDGEASAPDHEIDDLADLPSRLWAEHGRRSDV
jgi:putative hydrolase of the HAD superfamily